MLLKNNQYFVAFKILLSIVLDTNIISHSILLLVSQIAKCVNKLSSFSEVLKFFFLLKFEKWLSYFNSPFSKNCIEVGVHDSKFWLKIFSFSRNKICLGLSVLKNHNHFEVFEIKYTSREKIIDCKKISFLT